MFYQVQYLESTSPRWKAYGEAKRDLAEADRVVFELLSQHRAGIARYLTAVRIVSTVRHWDGVWRVRDVVRYQDVG